MVILVCTGAVLGFLNIYEPLAKFAGAGATVTAAQPQPLPPACVSCVC